MFWPSAVPGKVSLTNSRSVARSMSAGFRQIQEVLSFHIYTSILQQVREGICKLSLSAVSQRIRQLLCVRCWPRARRGQRRSLEQYQKGMSRTSNSMRSSACMRSKSRAGCRGRVGRLGVVVWGKGYCDLGTKWHLQ